MSNSDVKPYTDGELTKMMDTFHRDGVEGATDAMVVRFIGTIQEDRRKLAIAEKALDKIKKHVSSCTEPKSECYNIAYSLAVNALTAIRTDHTDA